MFGESTEISYGKRSPESFIREVLALDICSLFFRANFIECGEDIVGVFCTEGFQPLSMKRKITLQELFQYLINLIKEMRKAEQHFIYADEYEISAREVFADEYGRIKMIYRPSLHRSDGIEKLEKFTDEMAGKLSEREREYVMGIKKSLREGRGDARIIINNLERLRAEAKILTII